MESRQISFSNKIISGAGSKNITALPACHASDKVIEPLAIFTGKIFSLDGKENHPCQIK